MTGYKPVKLTPCTLAENCFIDSGKRWSVASLIERAKDLEPFDLPLCAVYIAANIFNPITSAKGLAEHVMRMNSVNMEHPVILDGEGFIMDGWHRVARALSEGRTTIKAVRFDETPPPNFVEPADE